MLKSRFLILETIIILFCASIASAWNDAGHMTVARIAWDILSTEERDAVVAILRQHPHLEILLLKDCPAEATPDEWIFLRASVWADYVRPKKDFPVEEIPNHPLYKFHRGTWHYVNFPYVLGQQQSELPAQPLPTGTNILDQLDESMNILVRRTSADDLRVPGTSDDANRAVRMTWLFHLLGDLHQPMHTISLVDQQLFPEPPHSDQGGNKVAVRTDSNAMPKNLHWIWDDMFSREKRFDIILQHSERLTHDPELLPSKLNELQNHPTIREWAAESYALAKTHGYQDGRLKIVLWDEVNANRIPASDVPIVPDEVMQQSRQIAQRRVALGGYRLATKIKEIVGKPKDTANP